MRGRASVLTAIATALDAHNLVADDPGRLPARLTARDNLDRAIYAWFSAHPSPDLTLLPNAPLVRELLTLSKREHEDVIELVMAQPDQVPVDVTGLSEQQTDPRPPAPRESKRIRARRVRKRTD